MESVVTVVIVEDHPLFRQALRQLVEAESGFKLVGEAGNGTDAISLIQQHRPKVAILDVNLPGCDGLEVARIVASKRLPTEIIILTMYKDEALFNKAMALEIKGFVLKENAVSDIVSSLKTVAKGNYFLSPSISSFLVKRKQRADALWQAKPTLDCLTQTELRVLRLIAQNRTSKEIAGELFVSPRTVEAHRANICTKLDLRGSHKLLQFAIEHRAEL